MEEGRGHACGFGLSREAHIAFAAAYIAVLVTVGGFGVLRFVSQLPPLHLPAFAAHQSHVFNRLRPVPDPAYPHVVNFYPRVAILNHQQGLVRLRLLVLSTGEVGDVNVVRSSGYPQLDAAALVTAGGWRYLPALRAGEPVSAEVDVAVRYRLASG